MDLIDEIGEIKYPDSKEAIEAARDAYDKLSEEGKTLVKNYDELTNAEDTYNAVKEVVDLINVIGEVKYPDSKEAIEAARSAYDELTDVQKELVGFDNYAKQLQLKVVQQDKRIYITDAQKPLITIYDVLETAEKDYATSKEVVDLIDAIEIPVTKENINKITEARKAYDKLTSDQKELVYNYEDLLDAEVGYVIELIKEIGTVAYTAESKALIDAAREAYDALSNDKLLVTNYNDLLNAEKLYATIDEVVKLINEIPSKLVISEDVDDILIDARDTYDLLTKDEQALVPADSLS